MFNRRVIVGYGCLIFGILGGFIPVIQGWLFIILGLMLLRPHVRWAEKLLDAIPKKFPKAAPIFKKAELKFDEILEKISNSSKN